MPALKLLAMLHKQGIEGDDALLLLAQARFQEAGLGAELYPESPEQLRQQLAFCPAGGPCTAHLPRGLNLLSAQTHARLAEFATVGAGRVYGLVLHDHNEFLARADDTVAAFRAADHQLGELSQAPLLFVEYAAGLPPDFFAALFERAVELRHVSACIDVSHVGIRACQTAYARTSPGVDVCALKTAPDLCERLESIQRAVAEALPVVVGLVERLAPLDKPIHFHLHDGHPLSALSRYGVSDHLSFLQQVPLPFEYAGRQLLDGMFGPAGLRAIVGAASVLPPEQLSFMMEVHPQPGRTPLGRHARLFSHWREVCNAERMNYWLDMLLLNAALCQDSGREAVGFTSRARLGQVE